MVGGLGSQPFWTFDGSVNMANRNLVFGASDVGFPGQNVTLSVTRTYNSRSNQVGKFGYGVALP